MDRSGKDLRTGSLRRKFGLKKRKLKNRNGRAAILKILRRN